MANEDITPAHRGTGAHDIISPHDITHAHVITGSFGAGKTTAIRWLMSQKPILEFWVVILNEFTDAGLDALRVAEGARGNFDVRLVSGGCLCCVGEVEFGRQLRDILKHLKPARLLIEPSGAGHAADIIDELANYEAQRALSLDSVICLVDGLDAERIWDKREGNEWAQIQSADVLLMSKADLASATGHQAFSAIAAAQFPAKQFLGAVDHGALPPQALQHYTRTRAFSLVRDEAAAAPHTREFLIAGLIGSETQLAQLGLWAVCWTLPPEQRFARVVLEPRINWLLAAHQTWIRRLKAVFRTGPGPSWLIQSHGRGLAAEDSAYRRDSRLEIVLAAEPTEDFLDAVRDALRDAVV